jgi:hypothetical protein
MPQNDVENQKDPAESDNGVLKNEVGGLSDIVVKQLRKFAKFRIRLA